MCCKSGYGRLHSFHLHVPKLEWATHTASQGHYWVATASATKAKAEFDTETMTRAIGRKGSAASHREAG
ncbi:hypothetical protein GQ600_6093 [Phytophthora cactorum]|nr:hypothetical protein GQ600_6093 [Phytophthora cactorum]